MAQRLQELGTSNLVSAPFRICRLITEFLHGSVLYICVPRHQVEMENPSGSDAARMVLLQETSSQPATATTP
jgi:hypothetical protein